ncbi:nuclear transport factor 2 family protein [Gemmobacter lutimaris]|jgi:taurine dehydrogenase small subunit|uniref:Nuclear transport factor 2 family protein n=2 Tax=Gemmobacter TaxID=204456 RepID=A0A398BSV7_9RHOB|nr:MULTISPECIES: nuclear transport factor 2 family protein [Gemmobacter]PTX48255.1 taurine dehydrogenase small subunit [Gemmobacter caeni]RID90453.1 nuclear transport factor 2 family protein [Gemmobacter lutimaris]TWI96879.1 taurine dehydrogenase small subunit [Gemmobacter caeni]
MTLTADDLKATFDAFNRHDIDAVMTHFAEDCVFTTVGGSEVFGTRIEGRDAIAQAFVAVWTAMPDAEWADHRHFVCGDRAVSEWTFRGTDAEGRRTEAQGVDLFTLRDGKLVMKQAFRKQRPVIQTR